MGRHRVTTVAPSDYSRALESDDPPNSDLQLHHVYGYQAGDNLYYLTAQSGEIVYPVASVGVVAHVHSLQQRFANQSTAARITALALHPSKQWAATGHQATSSTTACRLSIWSTSSMLERVDLHFHAYSIDALAFSPDGAILVSVGGERPHRTVAVWDWETKRLIAQAPLAPHSATVYSVKFNPFVSSPNGGVYEFVSCANSTLKWWQLNRSVLSCLNAELAMQPPSPTTKRRGGEDEKRREHEDVKHADKKVTDRRTASLAIARLPNFSFSTCLSAHRTSFAASRSCKSLTAWQRPFGAAVVSPATTTAQAIARRV